jgi:hypothetical protein
VRAIEWDIFDVSVFPAVFKETRTENYTRYTIGESAIPLSNSVTIFEELAPDPFLNNDEAKGALPNSDVTKEYDEVTPGIIEARASVEQALADWVPWGGAVSEIGAGTFSDDGIATVAEIRYFPYAELSVIGMDELLEQPTFLRMVADLPAIDVWFFQETIIYDPNAGTYTATQQNISFNLKWNEEEQLFTLNGLPTD